MQINICTLVFDGLVVPTYTQGTIFLWDQDNRGRPFILVHPINNPVFFQLFQFLLNVSLEGISNQWCLKENRLGMMLLKGPVYMEVG